MKGGWLLFFLLLFPCLAAGQTTPSLDLGLGGAAGLDGGKGNSDGLYRARARLGLAASGSEGYFFEGAFEAYAAEGFGAREALGRQPSLRFRDFPFLMEESGDFAAAGNLDRLNLGRKGEGWTLKLGRQPIGHGSGRFFNPTDIFAPPNPRAAWSEYKGGVDGARLTLPLGEFSDVEALFVSKKGDAAESYYLLKARRSFEGFDLSGYAGATLGEPTLALDLAFDLLGAGIYMEGFLRGSDQPVESARGVAGAHLRASPTVMVFAEYYHNGAGAGDASGYPAVISGESWRNGELFLLGKDYLAVGADWEAHPLLNLGLRAVTNLDDGSFLFLPNASYSASETVSVSLGASIGAGGRKTSEFGEVRDFIFAEIRLNL